MPNVTMIQLADATRAKLRAMSVDELLDLFDDNILLACDYVLDSNKSGDVDTLVKLVLEAV